jgi:uracil-DNA glycosylase family 4
MAEAESRGRTTESVEDDLQDWLGSARALLAEWVEEGVDGFSVAAAGSSAETGESATPRPEPAVPTGPTARHSSAGDVSQRIGPSNRGAAMTDRAPEANPETPVASAPDWTQRPTLEIVRETLGACQRCGLCSGRTNIVFGDGNPDADILFVGEGPGENEDLQGLPFVGRAGELLTQMIEKGMGIPRSQVYICNIVKCRPPNNRNPLPPEVAACRPFLDGQIAAVQPRVIVSLGKPAASLLLGRDVAITRVRGQWHEYRGTPLMPTLHPAYVLRQYTPENRRAVWEDLMAALERSRQA